MAQPPTLRVANAIKRRKQNTLALLREEARVVAATPDERFLAERLERSKARLRRASSDLESRLRVVSWVTAAGLAFMRWRSKRRRR
ncbi:MAG: hypothetical protein HC933_15625 [Pleurocapsa sp. SU_196_0]|nr:hypothetical protein [Pleurocapsa sp. SU_196_0]